MQEIDGDRDSVVCEGFEAVGGSDSHCFGRFCVFLLSFFEAGFEVLLDEFGVFQRVVFS